MTGCSLSKPTKSQGLLYPHPGLLPSDSILQEESTVVCPTKQMILDCQSVHTPGSRNARATLPRPDTLRHHSEVVRSNDLSAKYILPECIYIAASQPPKPANCAATVHRSVKKASGLQAGRWSCFLVCKRALSVLKWMWAQQRTDGHASNSIKPPALPGLGCCLSACTQSADTQATADNEKDERGQAHHRT